MKPSHGINKNRLNKLLTSLIDIYSPTGKEVEALKYIETYLKRAGFVLERQEVDEDRYNLIVHSDLESPKCVFIGHIDTVFAYDYDHYEHQIEGDEIFGLGSSDMKSGCAAMIEAFVSLKESGVDHIPASLAIVVGEEETNDGAIMFSKDHHFPWAIIGEPTDLVPCLSHYSYLETKFTTSGKQKHASVADRGDNPVKAMLSLLTDVIEFLNSNRKEVVYNIRDVNSAHCGFAVPKSCDAFLDLHFHPDLAAEIVTAELEEVYSQFKQKHSSVNGEMAFLTIHSGYQLPDKGILPEILKHIYQAQALPWKPGAFPSHSDANFLWASGIKTILLGPGTIDKAHTEDESVFFSQVCGAAEIYLEILMGLL
ncbi:MAG: M20/M25/M40 family metallo-hydrolase [Proteobacteria bacterium]|nr:M20/M25/M40 family metallo-hydrolase [Pseudomonadota bacterium]